MTLHNTCAAGPGSDTPYLGNAHHIERLVGSMCASRFIECEYRPTRCLQISPRLPTRGVGKRAISKPDGGTAHAQKPQLHELKRLLTLHVDSDATVAA